MGTKSEEKETDIQNNGLDQKKKINIQAELNEETRIQKHEERLRNTQDNFKHSNIQIIGVSEREEEQQGIEDLFEKRMEENFSILAKEIHFQEVQEAERVPKILDARKHTSRHIIITLPKIKGKKRILK